MAELLVVLVMIAILAGMAMPSFVSSWREERLRSTTRNVISMMRLARSRAVNEAHPTRLTFDKADGRYFVTELVEQDEDLSVSVDVRPPQRDWEVVRTFVTRERALPEEVRLTYIGPGPDQTQAERVQERRRGTAGESESEPPENIEYIEFNPDGTAEPTYVGLANTVDSRTVVEVDEVTGGPVVLSPEDMERLLQILPMP